MKLVLLTTLSFLSQSKINLIDVLIIIQNLYDIFLGRLAKAFISYLDYLELDKLLNWVLLKDCLSSSMIVILYALMYSSFWFDTINLGWSVVYMEGLQIINPK